MLAESQIYRIDHYLGKETVQNIMVLRFANGMFEPLWNRNHIDHVQITVAETVGVEQRGKFYDATGALRDMVPNHLFQLLTLIAMEPPTCFDAEAVRTEKAKVLEAAHAFGREDARRNVVRAQYGAGSVEGQDGHALSQRAPTFAADSTTETYVALKLVIDNWRWAGVPFYVRTGKALAARRSEVVIQFKQAPFALFRDTPVERLTPNDMPDSDPAGGRRDPAVQRQNPRTQRPHGRCRDEVQLQGPFPCRAEHRLRDTDLRLHDG